MDTVSVLRLTKQGATKVMEAALEGAEAKGPIDCFRPYG